MNRVGGAIASVVGGIALGLVAILGGVAAVTPDTNPASASGDVVRYDAP
jgi:hypothetical protein